MKVRRYKGDDERKILAAVITDDVVLAHVSSIFESQMFATRWGNLVAKWCVSYYNKYEEAPKQAIERIFEKWARKNEGSETVPLIERFLSDVSSEWESDEEINSKYLLEQVGNYFNKVRIKRLQEKLEDQIDLDLISEALESVTEFNRVELGSDASVNVLSDMNAVRDAFTVMKEPLITYQDGLGRFFSSAMERDGFIAFQGKEKIGKSFWLLDVAWRAMLERRKVAYFIIGDMSQEQVMRRVMCRAARHPLRLSNGFPGTVYFPKQICREGEEVSVSYSEKHFKKPLSWQKGWQAIQEVQERLKTRTSLLKLSCHPSLSLSVEGIKSILKSWEVQDWLADVVVIDYADNLVAPSSIREYRHQINHVWKQLRALSQSLHCLVVTATQADAGSYSVATQTRQNFSDDKRKLGEVTGLVGINQTEEEKEKGLCRLNWLVLREGEFYETRCCYIAECRAIANISAKSTM